MKNTNPILTENASFDYTEAYVRLRTNFIYTTLNGDIKTVVFTSCEQGEGKSTTVLNLAISLAKSGKKVLLIDCDVRRSSMRLYLRQKDRMPGLAEILCNIRPVKDCIGRMEKYGFDIIFSGSNVPNPSELLGSKNMRKLLDAVAPHYDYVLLDAPPVLSVSDPAILSTMADGVVFIVKQGQIKKKEYAMALSTLEAVDAKMLGCIMNMYETKRDHSYYGYGKKYYYRKYYEYSKKGYGKKGKGE